MKKIVSIILALALIASLVPATFALESDGSQIITFDSTLDYARNTKNSSKITISATGVINHTNIQTRRYVDSMANGYMPYIGIPIVVEKSGEYEIHFKSNKQIETGSVPNVYIAAGEVPTSRGTDPHDSTKKDRLMAAPNSFTARTNLGLFNFSKNEAGKFLPVTSSGTPEGTVETYKFEAGKTYHVLIAPHAISRAYNPIISSGTTTLNLTEDYMPLAASIVYGADGNPLYKNGESGEALGAYVKGAINPTTGVYLTPGSVKLYLDTNGTELPYTKIHKYTKTDGVYIVGDKITNFGEAIPTAYYQQYYLSAIKLVPVVKEDTDYVEDFDAEVEDYTTSGKAIVDAYTFAGEEAILSANNEVTLGNTFNVTAPEIEGYNFLYWAKGTSESKLVVSYENELTFKPSEGRNSLIAVYAEESAEVNRAEFYNANGTLIKTLTADGKAPEYPSMAGYGNADGWQLYGSETIYGAGEDIAVSGNMIFVAKYPETPGKVTVNGTEYTYGETVTMPELDSSKIFKGWKRNDEIVSVNPNYTFKAYENATVEAVYAENTPVFSGKFMKIVIDSFSAGDKTAVMAEFIGIENAVEKGIMIGDTKKIAMKGNGNQFSILADVPNATYVGYAILKNGTTFAQVIDGAFPN